MDEKFCLKWNDFHENTIKTFSKLRHEEEFFDVTLVSDDLKQLMAHRVVLSSSSEYFKSILKTNKHSHPMLCLPGISHSDLENVLNYVYHGEVQIFQENIDKFLEIAQRLRLDGLLATNENKQSYQENPSYNNSMKLTENDEPQGYEAPIMANKNEFRDASSAISIPVTGSLLVDEIDQKVMEYLGKNENGELKCNICGKFGGNRTRNMKFHIETHLEGIAVSCDVCGKQFRSRNSLFNHKSQYHKNK